MRVAARNQGRTLMEKSQQVLIVKGKAGLGNRFLSVLGCIAYCSANNRWLCIDWSDGTYAAKGEDAFGLTFRCNVPSVSLAEVVDKKDVVPLIWRNNLRRSVEEMIDEYDPKFWDDEMAVFPRYSIQFWRGDHQNEVVVRWSYHDDIGEFFPRLGMRFFNEGCRFQFLRCIVQKHIKLQDSLHRELETHSARLLIGETIGIHIRYTDNKSPLPVLLARLEHLAVLRSSAKIFLATDNAKIETRLKGMYPGRVLTIGKYMPEDGSPLHHQRQGFEAMRYAMLDMFLLSKCDFLIYSSRSTFGYCAALMSQAPSVNIFDCLHSWQRVKRALVSIKWNLWSWLHRRD